MALQRGSSGNAETERALEAAVRRVSAQSSTRVASSADSCALAPRRDLASRPPTPTQRDPRLRAPRLRYGERPLEPARARRPSSAQFRRLLAHHRAAHPVQRAPISVQALARLLAAWAIVASDESTAACVRRARALAASPELRLDGAELDTVRVDSAERHRLASKRADRQR